MPIDNTVLIKYRDKGDVFIETGSHIGGTIDRAVKAGFREVYSIELAKHHYQTCVNKFKGNPNVHLYLGASEYELPKILKKVNEKCVFWLDGHYSFGDTALGETPCPLYLELEAIAKHEVKEHTILIDDVRLFGTEWKHISMDKIKEHLKAINPDYKFSFENGHKPNDILVAQL